MLLHNLNDSDRNDAETATVSSFLLQNIFSEFLKEEAIVNESQKKT